MIIRDDRTTNSPPGIAMSLSPEYPLDGGKIQQHHQLWCQEQYPFHFPVNWKGELFSKLLIFYALFFQQNCFTWSEIFHKKSFTDTVGPMATITDSLFSLIIFIYVMVTFLYLFYGFCWIDAPKKTQADLEEENKLVRIFPNSQLGCFLKIKRSGALCFALENKLVRPFPDSQLGCFLKDQKKWNTLLCFGDQTGACFPRFSIGSSFEDL